MKVLATYKDGSQTILYEPGDRIRVLKIDAGSRWLIEPGDCGVVWGYTHVKKHQSPIDFLDIRTDKMIKGSWGIHSVAPWDIELEEDNNG